MANQKYEFDFFFFFIDDSFEPGENIYIYLDGNNNIVSVTHRTENYGLYINIILMLVVPIALLLVHAFVGRKTYAKNWNLYVQWYKKEIEPYRYQDNFENIVTLLDLEEKDKFELVKTLQNSKMLKFSFKYLLTKTKFLL